MLSRIRQPVSSARGRRCCVPRWKSGPARSLLSVVLLGMLGASGSQLARCQTTDPPLTNGYSIYIPYNGTYAAVGTAHGVALLPAANHGHKMLLLQVDADDVRLPDNTAIHGFKRMWPILGTDGAPVFRPGADRPILVGSVAMVQEGDREGYVLVTLADDQEIEHPGAAATGPRAPIPPPAVPPSAFPSPEGPIGSPAAGPFRPLALPVQVSGLSAANTQRAQRALEPFNLAVTQGGAPHSVDALPPARQGAAFSVVLMRGTLGWMSVTGAITQVSADGKQFSALGHAFTGLGQVTLPAVPAYVHAIVPGSPQSRLVASPMAVPGNTACPWTLAWDGPTGVRVDTTTAAPTLSVEVTVNGNSATAHEEITSNPLLAPRLLPLVVDQAIANARPAAQPTQATVNLRVFLKHPPVGIPQEIDRTDVFYDPQSVDRGVEAEFAELLRTLSDNPYQPLEVDHVTVQITLKDVSAPPPAVVEGVVFQPGPAGSLNVTAHVRIGIPGAYAAVNASFPKVVLDQAQNGPALLVAQGGSSRFELLDREPEPDLQQHLNAFTTGARHDQVRFHLIYTPRTPNPQQIQRRLRDDSRDGSIPPVFGTVFPTGAVTALVQIGPPQSAQPPDVIPVARFRLDGETHEARLVPGAETSPIIVAAPPSAPTAPPAPPSPSVKLPVQWLPEDWLIVPKPESRGTRTLSRTASLATQSTGADFQGGTFVDTALTASGSVILGDNIEQRFPPPQSSEPLPDSAVTSVAELHGWVYAGTGSVGNIYRFHPEGPGSPPSDDPLQPFYHLALASINALAPAGQHLVAATAHPARLVVLDEAGNKNELRLAESGQARDSGPVTALAVAADSHTIYAGTGAQPDLPGEVWQVDIEVTPLTPRLIATLPSGGVSSLCILPSSGSTGGGILASTPDNARGARLKDELLIGTEADPAIVYGLAREKAVVPLFAAGPGAITGLVPAPATGVGGTLPPGQPGTHPALVYAATAGGEIYRVEQDHTGRILFKTDSPLHGLIPGPGNTLFSCSDQALIRVQADGAAHLTRAPVERLLCLAPLDRDRVLLGSRFPAAVLVAGAAQRGYFISTPIDVGQPAHWGRITLEPRLHTGAKEVETRVSDVPLPEGDRSGWRPATPVVKGATEEFYVNPINNRGRYLQYKIPFVRGRLETLRSITFVYRASDAEPDPRFVGLGQPAILTGRHVIQIDTRDPEGDTLRYSIQYHPAPFDPASGPDPGQDWYPIGRAPNGAAGGTLLPPTYARQAVHLFQDRADLDPVLAGERRQKELRRIKEEAERAVKRLEEEAAEHAQRSPRDADFPPDTHAQQAVGEQHLSLVWDTRQVPDGRYYLRVTVNDYASNLTDGLQVVRVGAPVIVMNTGPTAFLFPHALRLSNGHPFAFGMVFGGVPLTGGQYRVDEGPWKALDPTTFEKWPAPTTAPDLWGATFHAIRVPLEGAGDGRRVVDLKLIDQAGNAIVKRLRVLIPRSGD